MKKMDRRWFWGLALVLIAAGAGFTLLGVSSLWSSRQAARDTEPLTLAPPSAPPAPSATEPILPPPPTAIQAPTDLPTMPTTTSTTLAPTDLTQGLYTLRQRLGLGAVGLDVTRKLAQQLGFGWYLDWTAGPDRYHSTEVEYMPTIRLMGGHPQPGGQDLLAIVDAHPGALWLIGNEPDVRWQDNVSPETYAELYHDLYTILKEHDPSCQVAIGGVSQPTPLRLRYLDRILAAYQARYGEPMPVDVWNVHNFILREERDSWGVDIPPGMTDQTGALYEITDHDDVDIFCRQLVDFRHWMKERGQQDKPLVVTEYGILMPTEYGFPPQQVERFMLDTFEFFRTATDPDLGDPTDGYRLVQRWCWFSLADDRYPTGNLADRESGELTPLGQAFRAYAYSSPR